MEYELYHHGILGQKWGVRRYQNDDGSLTPAGAKRYGQPNARTAKQYKSRLNDIDQAMAYITKDVHDATLVKGKLSNKQAKLKKKGKDLGIKDIERKREAEAKLKEAIKNYKKGTKECQKLVKEATKAGYTVKSRNIMRSAAKGEDFAKIMLTSLALAPVAALTGVMVIQTGPQVKGTHYSVKVAKQNPQN